MRSIVLTKMVKELGYKNPSKLSNWIRNIIVEKEDFEKRFFCDTKGPDDDRVEKYEVYESARIFVDNLCILLSYKSFFQKAPALKPHLEKNIIHTPYRILKKGYDQREINKKYKVVKDRLKFEKDITEEALKNLPLFVSALKKGSIDITTDSIRDMMEMSDGSVCQDLSESYNISLFQDIYEIVDEIDIDNNNHILHIKLALKYYQLGLYDDALDAIEKSLSIKESVNAWVLSSKIYFELINNADQNVFKSASFTEFQGLVESPINSEELWVNDQLDSSFKEYEMCRHNFVASCLQALELWPISDLNFNYTKSKKDFEYLIRFEDFHVTRGWIFFNLICNVKDEKSIYDKKNLIIDSLNSFIIKDSKYELPDFMFSSNSLESQKILVFHKDIIIILNLISKNDCESYITNLINYYTSKDNNESKTFLEFISHPEIKIIFYNFLGGGKFFNLYSELENKVFSDYKNKKFKLLCSIQLDLIKSDFIDVSKIIADYHSKKSTAKFIKDLDLDEDSKSKLQDNWEKLNSTFRKNWTHDVKSCYARKNDYYEIIKHPVWSDKPFSPEQCDEAHAVIFLYSLIDIYKNNISEPSINVLLHYYEISKKDYSVSLPVFKKIIESLEDHIVIELLDRIINKYSAVKYPWVLAAKGLKLNYEEIYYQYSL